MALAYTYGSEEGIVDRLGELGVELYTDDITPTRLRRARERATTKINQYALRLYTGARLSESEWVKDAADDIATYYLCTGRGNAAPSSVKEQFDRVLLDLERVNTGNLKIPDIAVKKSVSPVMSNMTMRQTPVQAPRVQRTRSTGKAEGYSQREDGLDPHRYATDYSI